MLPQRRASTLEAEPSSAEDVLGPAQIKALDDHGRERELRGRADWNGHGRAFGDDRDPFLVAHSVTACPLPSIPYRSGC